MDFIGRIERKEGRRIRNASMAGREEFMRYIRERNKRILENREGLSDVDALQRFIDFTKRKGFEQPNKTGGGFLKVMIPASLVVFCISPVFIFTMEWPGNILLTFVTVWAFIICLELRSMTRHQETIIRILEEELELMRKEKSLETLRG